MSRVAYKKRNYSQKWDTNGLLTMMMMIMNPIVLHWIQFLTAGFLWIGDLSSHYYYLFRTPNQYACQNSKMWKFLSINFTTDLLVFASFVLQRVSLQKHRQPYNSKSNSLLPNLRSVRVPPSTHATVVKMYRKSYREMLSLATVLMLTTERLSCFTHIVGWNRVEGKATDT